MKYKLQDLINIAQFQSLQDKLNDIYSFPSAIVDNDGNILTATAWQDVCTKFHRTNAETEKQCIISDQYIASHIHEANPAVTYKCPLGLVDNALPIIIDGLHYGNFFTGQFFLEPPNLDFFREQARKYGFDQESYLDAVKKVPIWSKEQLDSYLSFISGLIEVIAGNGLKNLQVAESNKLINKSEEEFRSIFELNPAGIMILGIKGKILKVNKAFCGMLGRSESELLSMTIKEITHTDDVRINNEWVNKLLNAEAVTADYKKRYLHKSGQVVWGDVRSLLKRDPEGRPAYFITHIQDISKSKLAEAKLGDLTLRTEAILASVPDIIMQVDSSKTYTWANKAGYDFFGKDVIGKEASYYFECEQETYLEVQALFNGSQENVYIESWQRRKDGQVRLLGWQCHTLRDSKGEVTGTISSARDLTEQEKVREELLKSQTLYHDLVETAQDLIWQCDAEGRYTYLNPAWEDVFGYTLEEMLGKKFTDFQTREFAERDRKEFKRLLKRGTVKGWETVHRGKNDKKINLVFNAKIVHNEDGEVIGTSGTAFNVSNLKKAESALHESKGQFSALFDAMNEGVVLHEVVYDKKKKVTDYRIINANQAFEKITGMPAEKAKNMLASKLYASNPAPFLDIYSHVAETAETTRFETYFPLLEKHFDISVVTPTKGSLATIFTDITDRIHSQEKIKESEKRFRSIVENTEAGYFFMDKEGIIKDVNMALVKLYKYSSKDEILGKHHTEIDNIDDIAAANNFIEKIMQSDEKLMKGEMRRQCRDGTVGYHSYSAKPVQKLGEVVGIEGFILDITERKLAEDKIKNINAELELRVHERTLALEDANREMESFVYSISHDLRAPLRSIMGFSEIISKRHIGNLNEEGIEYFGYILKASKNMANLIEDLLNFSRLTKSPVKKVLININEIMEAVKQNLHQDILDHKAKIIFPDKISELKGDRSLLVQIFTNLIHNAIIYHREGAAPEVIVSAEENQNSIIVSIKDNGEGIAKEHHEKIFNIFQRLHSSDEYPGTGIGLSIVKKAVYALGGTITLESEISRGSTFSVTLPKE